MKLTERTSCRVCEEPLIDVFDLGMLPISSFPLPSDPDPKQHPLILSLSEKSGLVQLKHTVDSDEMYSQYWYMSGVNSSMKMALKSIVDQVVSRTGSALTKGDVVLDIASNDGTLLGFYPSDLYRVGIDPAKNIQPKNCDLHINTYFSFDAYRNQMKNRKAKIVTSISMFYDLEDPVRFAQDVSQVLDKDGLWVIELSYLPTMLEQNSFDTICAESIWNTIHYDRLNIF